MREDQTRVHFLMGESIIKTLGDHVDLRFIVFERFPQAYPPFGFYERENVSRYHVLKGCGVPARDMVHPFPAKNRTYLAQGMGLGIPTVLIPIWSAMKEYAAMGSHFEKKKTPSGVPDCTHVVHASGWFAILHMMAEAITELDQYR